MMRRYSLIFTGIFLLLLASNAIPALRGGWGWQWDYGLPENATGVILLAMSLCLYLGGVVITRRVARGRVLWALMGAVFLSVAVMGVRDDALYLAFTRTVSPVYSGASTVAVHNMDNVGEALDNWTLIMDDLAESSNIHMALSPPGKALVHRWLADAFTLTDPLAQSISDSLRPLQCSALPVMAYTRGEMAATLFGILMPLWAALTVIPLYFCAVLLSDDRDSSARMVQWWALVPSILFFAISWNTFYPLLVMSSFTLLILALKRERMVYALGSGAVMSIATFLNFSVVPALMLMGWFALGYGYFYTRSAENRTLWGWLRVPVLVGVWYGVGLAVAWVWFWLMSGHMPLDVLQTAFDQHLSIERNYFIWLILHVYDLVLFAGLPLVILALWLVWRVVRKQESLNLLALAVISAMLTIVIVDVSDTARGETARVWLFFVPFLLLAVTAFGKKSRWWDMPLLVGQAVTVLVIVTVIPQMETFLNPPPQSPTQQVDTSGMIVSEARFSDDDYDGAFTLMAYRAIGDPAQQTITFDFVWRGDVPTERPYEFEMIARAENPTDGEIVTAPQRWYAQGGNYLTPCWQNGDMVHEVVLFALPAISEPVVWDVELRAVDDRVGTQTIVTLSDEMTTEVLQLAPISYP